MGKRHSVVGESARLATRTEMLTRLIEQAPWKWPRPPICFICEPHADAEAFMASLVAAGVISKIGPRDQNFVHNRPAREARVLLGGDCFDNCLVISELLKRLHDLLVRIGHPRADEIASLGGLYQSDKTRFWQEINANSLWAGAGSLAADTMMDNPGLSDAEWDSTVREFRELLAGIGEEILTRDDANPGISSWVLAFRNWNASEV